MVKKKIARPRYQIELNRSINDSTRRVVRTLERKGYEVDRLGHKTAFTLKRPLGQSFSDFQDDIRSILNPRIGSALICSSTGRAWLCSMKSNQPGDFVRI